MPPYYVEGLYATKLGVQKKHNPLTLPASSIEPYARTIWADSPEEAIQIATAELSGGEWIEGPRLSQMTEEQRMRSSGAPEFQGIADLPTHRGKRK